MSDVQQNDLIEGTIISGEIEAAEHASLIVSGEPADLSAKIEELRREASEQREKYLGHNKRLKTLLCRGLILWLAASKRPDEDPVSLKSLLRNIGKRGGDDTAPNFNPWIAYIFGFSTTNPTKTEKATKSQWNRAMQGLYAAYIVAPENFRHDPQARLESYYDRRGGVGGFLKNFDPDAEDGADPANPDPTKRGAKANAVLAKVRAEVVKHRQSELDAGGRGIGQAELTHAVRVNDKNLVVLLARVIGDSVTILGSTNRPDLIDAILSGTQGDSRHKVPLALRALSDVVATQLFPVHALPPIKNRPEWFRDVYYEDGEVERDGKNLRTSKRLFLRGAGILLSKSRISVSPVTRCLLKSPLINLEEQVFLKGDELQTLEKLIENGVEVVMDVDPMDRLKPKPASGKGTFVYTLQIRNDAAGYKKDFHFYQAAAESSTQYQADFVRWDAFKPTWSVKVSPGFFVKLRAVFTDPWFAGHGHARRISRPENETLRVEVGRDTLRIFFNSADDQLATIAFDNPPAEWNDPVPTTFLSKDLAPILFNLADAAVSGDVEIAGNEHALAFRYENEIGKYEIAVPTLVDVDQRKRDRTLFIGFGKPQP